MKKALVFGALTGIFVIGGLTAAIRENSDYQEYSESTEEKEELMRAEEAMDDMETYTSSPPQRSKPRTGRRVYSGDEGFIASPNWEFDGFVVGGQGQDVRSMFVVNDLIYLNVGFIHGFNIGDQLGVYKRGPRIKDPQSGRFLGFEVQKVGQVQVTTQIEDETCSVRVLHSNTGIEIGDLVRRLN